MSSSHFIRLSKYEPIIKPKGFDPQPVKRYGIPLHADSQNNPNCKGTRLWEEYWHEQIDRCVNGYTTGGLYLSGRFYYYLNFCPITTVKRGTHLPEFVDVDYEYSELIEEVKRDHKGIIMLKGRRRGASEKTINMEVDYGMRFKYMGYQCAVGTGIEKYALDFSAKLLHAEKNRPPELRINYLTPTPPEIVAGYKVKTDQGWIRDGSLSTVKIRTMYNDENVLKGTFLDACIFEEAGENELLEAGFNATQDSFKIGDRMIGTPYVYGTGGNIKKGSKDFMAMWEAAESYHLVRCSIFAQRLNNRFYIGSRDENGDVNDSSCVNLKKLQAENGYAPEQMMGCEDIEASLESINREKERLRRGKSMKKYHDEIQNWATNEKEVFLNLGSNDFNAIALAEQFEYLGKLPEAPYRTYRLEWETDEHGETLIPLKVKMIEFDMADYPKGVDSYVMVYAPPAPNFVNMDVAGLDPYDQDKSLTSKSLGAMVVLRRNAYNLYGMRGNSLAGKKVPVALVRCRPGRKEEFYELCAKVAVLYNLKKNVMIDAGSSRIVDYFKLIGMEGYLAKRPLAYESAKSTQTHVYGMKFTTSPQSKERVFSLLQTYVDDFIDECPFVHIVDGMQNYDTTVVESDWDEVDALGLALVMDSVIRRQPEEEKKKDKDDAISEFGEFVHLHNGIIVPRARKTEDREETDMESVTSSFD